GPAASRDAAVRARRPRGPAIASAAVLIALIAAAALRLRRDDGVVEVKSDRAAMQRALQAADEAIAAHRYSEAAQFLEVARGTGAAAQELGALNRTQDEADAERRYGELEAALAARDVARARAILEPLASARSRCGRRAPCSPTSTGAWASATPARASATRARGTTGSTCRSAPIRRKGDTSRRRSRSTTTIGAEVLHPSIDRGPSSG